jgi:nitrogen fixation protein FixH
MRIANAAPPEAFTLKGWHVWTMLGLFFGTIIAVNAAFITLAMQTFPGEDVKRSYVQGLNYNQTLAARARQMQLGWQIEAAFDKTGASPALIVQMRSRNGAPLSGATLSGALRRAVTDRQDHGLTFVETMPGQYRADLPGLEAGGWLIRAEAARDGERFEFTGRLAW